MTEQTGPSFTGPLGVFINLDDFKAAVRQASGGDIDFDAVLGVNSDFMVATGGYLILNVHDYSDEDLDNLLFLAEHKALLFSTRPPAGTQLDAYQHVVNEPFGASTVLAFATLSKVFDSYKAYYEGLLVAFKKLDEEFDYRAYRSLATRFDRMNDHLEEFHELLLRLQQRAYKQIETQFIAVDYSVLLAECSGLEGRARRRMALLKDLREDHDAHQTNELNLKIANLNYVVRKLTAITVILMLPTLIASHFGMNFEFMPELHVPWAYGAVIASQVVIAGLGIWLFRKNHWL